MELIASAEGLGVASAAHASNAAEVAGVAAGTAVPTMAVLPGTLSPAVIAGTARVIAHGAERLAVSSAGAALMGAIAASVAESGAGYTSSDDAGAAALTV
jgi:hypothetical protein